MDFINCQEVIYRDILISQIQHTNMVTVSAATIRITSNLNSPQQTAIDCTSVRLFKTLYSIAILLVAAVYVVIFLNLCPRILVYFMLQ